MNGNMQKNLTRIALAFMVLALAAAVFTPVAANTIGTTYIVNTNDDVVDPTGCNETHCSFREAILAAEQNIGEDTIVFDGDYVISPIALLPVITEKLTIDGSGHSVTLDGSLYLSLNNITCPPQYTGIRSHPGLVFYQANNSKVTGMIISNWCNGITVHETDGGEWTDNFFSGSLGNAQLDFLYSDFNRTVGNVFWQDPINPTLTSGDQVELQHSSSNYFSGNVLTGGENAYEILFDSNNNVIEGDVITSCFRGSIELRGNVHGNIIRNNDISNGVRVITEEGAILHGYENGISLDWNSDDNIIEGNVITNVPDSGIAIIFLEGIDSTNDGNIIRNNTISETGMAGILVGSGIRNRLSGNVISSVGGIGIDLSDLLKVIPDFYNLNVSYPDGVTPNDSGLAANNGQNYPVLSSALAAPGQLVVRGTISSPDPQSITIEFFANPADNPSGYGEGAVYLGVVTPNLNGEFTATLPPAPAGTHITATATDAAGNTSEFSANIEARLP